MLIALHIKPWKNCENDERLGAENGLWQTPNLDKAFDRGYISFDSSGKIMISSELEGADLLGTSKDMKICDTIRINDKYMHFHRESIFFNSMQVMKISYTSLLINTKHTPTIECGDIIFYIFKRFV